MRLQRAAADDQDLRSMALSAKYQLSCFQELAAEKTP
jgi:hypothetical protein